MAEGPVEEQAPAPDEGELLDIGKEDEAAKRTVYLLTLSRLLPETLQAAEGALRSLEELTRQELTRQELAEAVKDSFEI